MHLLREGDVLQKIISDCLVPANRLVCIAAKQQELTVGERSGTMFAIDAIDGEDPHQKCTCHGLHEPLEETAGRERTENAQQRCAPFRCRCNGCSHQARIEGGVRIGKQKPVSCGSQRADAGGIALAGPVIRATLIFDDDDAAVFARVSVGDLGGSVRAAIEHHDDFDLAVGLLPQATDAGVNAPFLVVRRNHDAHFLVIRRR